jgi:hypothetical protein
MANGNRRKFMKQIGLAAVFGGALPRLQPAGAMPQGERRMTLQK